jgi:hypothetical protein
MIGPAGSEVDRSWNRIGRNAGYVAGVAFLVGTVLYLLVALKLPGPSAWCRTPAWQG